jgi:DNA-binding IclR family transcriptional regulator
MGNQKKDILSSVHNALSILNLFSPQTLELGLSEIAKKTGFNKSSVHRLLTTLSEEGFVTKNPETRRYRLGLTLLQLSGVALSHLEIHQAAKNELEELAEKTGETAHLGIIENGEVIYLYKAESKRPIKLTSVIGKSNPAHCTGIGKIILAYQPRIAEAVIERGLFKCGPTSITDPEEFLHELKRINQQGFVVCIDDTYQGVVSIAVPLRNFTGEVVAGISIVGHKHHMDQLKIADCIRHVVKAGLTISANLGYYPESSRARLSVTN